MSNDPYQKAAAVEEAVEEAAEEAVEEFVVAVAVVDKQKQ